MQKTVNFTGIDDFLNHDACATESMGAIFDRSKEHLGVSDKAVIAVRKFLLTAVKELQDGKEPPHLVRDTRSATGSRTSTASPICCRATCLGASSSTT